MNADQFQITIACHCEDGRKINIDSLGITVCKYAEQFCMWWHQPFQGNLGREFKDAAELERFMRGDNNAGVLIRY